METVSTESIVNLCMRATEAAAMSPRMQDELKVVPLSILVERMSVDVRMHVTSGRMRILTSN